MSNKRFLTFVGNNIPNVYSLRKGWCVQTITERLQKNKKPKKILDISTLKYHINVKIFHKIKLRNKYYIIRWKHEKPLRVLL